MGGVWVVFPTANVPRAEETAKKWAERGYASGFLINAGDGTPCRFRWTTGVGYVREYPAAWGYAGYYHSQNSLAWAALDRWQAEAVVCAGDDMDPDPTKGADEILAECRARYPDGCYVMQPTGDPQGPMKGVPAAARICGSPWLGPAYVRRGYGGAGAYHEAYHHFGGDHELKIVAEKLGILWQRPELSHFHRHHSWGHSPRTTYQAATEKAWWDHDIRLFEERKAAGWPGHTLGAP